PLKLNLKIQNMNLFFDTELGKQQNKATHKIRVMSEAWLEKTATVPVAEASRCRDLPITNLLPTSFVQIATSNMN
ncbi:TPA: hypothetical protein WID87_001877, partial [Neisseria meningitidis]